MSFEGSIVSVCTSVATDPRTEERSLLQRCLYVRDWLHLNLYKSTGETGTVVSTGPHVKISSKTLRECYVVPAEGGCIENIFARLAELMHDSKLKRMKPPRTDFTCLSRLECNKVFIDVDCMVCKSGEPVGERRHFSFTKSLNLVMSTVDRVFDRTVTEWVYMTVGGQSCGYHLFFNSLTFSRDGVTAPVLMDALDDVLKREMSNRVAVDRACTQMPLPTAGHSKSTRYTVPYVLKKCEDVWKKERLNWVDMDADTLMCFSSIAFPGGQNISTSNGIATPIGEINKNLLSDLTDLNKLDSNTTLETLVGKRKRVEPVNESNRDKHEVESPVTKKPCRTPVTTNETDPLNYTVLQTEKPPVEKLSHLEIVTEVPTLTRSAEDKSDIASVFSSYTEATSSDINSFICPTEKRLVKTPSDPDMVAAEIQTVIQSSKDENDIASVFSAHTSDMNSFICPRLLDLDRDTTEVPTPRPVPQPLEDGNDDASVFSTQTDASIDMNSFICPAPPSSTVLRRPRERNRRKSNGKDRHGINGQSTVFTNTLGFMPYECENEKTSPFADKQYKATLLCAEEAEAMISKTSLSIEKQEPNQRVYITPGSSSNMSREYKLLVQLVNVKRSVYGGDLASRREWTDLLVSYFDQHLCNPVILEILKFVFSFNSEVDVTFDQNELEEIKRSIVHVMASFRRRTEEEERERQSTAPDQIGGDEQEEREARPHKARIIGALIRVCTHLFGMVTAIVSDLRRIQRAKEFKDLSLLNRTVVSEYIADRTQQSRRPTEDFDDDDLDCSASMRGDGGDGGAEHRVNSNSRRTTNYTLLASLIVHEQVNVSDQALYAFLYYYHCFPSIIIDRLLDEVQHDGLMVTAVIKYYMMYGHRGKPLTLQEIFEGFNDTVISLSGPENFILVRRKNQRRNKSNSKKHTTNNNNNNNNKDTRNNKSDRNKRGRQRDRSADSTTRDGETSNDADGEEEDANLDDSSNNGVTRDEIQKLLSGTERKRRRLMCNNFTGPPGERPQYEWKDKHLWQAVINYYLRPVVMHEDRLVFANDSYNTFEDDAVESCVAHIMTISKNTKADVTTAFKDARTVWCMHHSSQFIYESDLMSDTVGCCFHINIALKMYEMFCGGCVTRMKRVHRNYLIDRSRFNMNVYDVVAECRTATVNLTSAIDRSYMNLLLRQPVVPPFLEDEETRRLFMSDAEMDRGSFCCLNVMDYRRVINLFERSNCRSKPELETCEYVENFLDDLYTNEVAGECPPDTAAESRMRTLYAFYSLYLYEVVFNMRHSYARRENCFISIERLSYELDIHEILILFFNKSSMRRVEGLDEELENRIRQTAQGLNNTGGGVSGGNDILLPENTSSSDNSNSIFDIRPKLASEIPEKTLRMKTLFGKFGFDVMQETTNNSVSTLTLGCAQQVNDSDCLLSKLNVSTSSCADEENRSERNCWHDEDNFEHEFYACENWTDRVCERIRDAEITGKTYKQTPTLAAGTSRGDGVFERETVKSVLHLQLKRHIDHDRMGKLAKDECDRGLFTAMRQLPMRLKLMAFILTTHTFKLKTKRLATDFVAETYGGGNTDEHFTQDHRRVVEEEPEKIWYRTTEAVLSDRCSLLSHARWLAERKFTNSFFIGLDPASVYNVLHEYMRANKDRYPAFKKYDENEDTRSAAANLCTAMMYILVMSAYDQEHVDLYLRVFLAAEWPGQWAKTIFVWKSNSNAGKSYLFDSIVKRACANSTCINDPKGGKENAPEKAEYVKNFVLFANEFSQANSNELKKIVSESTFKFRMNYGNMMNEAYATGKIMFNCNTLPPTSDEAAINRLTLFNIPFWFSRRQKISDAMLNWICGLSDTSSRATSGREMAYRYELPSLLSEAEKNFLESHSETKNEMDLFNGYAAVRPSLYTTESNKALSPLFLVQNKISHVYALSSPPTDHIVYGLVNITNHFSWLRFFKRLDMPVDFSSLPASSEAVRSEWLGLTLPYQEWKQITGARIDPSSRVAAETINKSLKAFAVKKGVQYFGIKQFFETDFASSREAIKDEYYIRFNSKVFCD